MRYRIFLDTNILLSGIFFEGNEAKVLDMPGVDLVTAEDAVDELKKIVRKKLKYLGDRTLEIALLEIERALYDIQVLPRKEYLEEYPKAKELITHGKDVPILAAVLSAKPDYLLTGDVHFFTEKVRSVMKVKTARQFLDRIKRR
ncbi:MAG: PIN domain-containing protein [Pseudomonadota bacterium]